MEFWRSSSIRNNSVCILDSNRNKECEKRHSRNQNSYTPHPSDTPLFRGEYRKIPLRKGGTKRGM